MSRRTWTVGFLALTAAAVGLEIWAAVRTGDESSPAWTDLIVRWVPAPVALAAVGLLTAWLDPHFRDAYRRAGAQPEQGGIMGGIRKAVVAGLGAGITAATSALLVAAPDGFTSVEVQTILGAGVAALLAVGWATWRVRNVVTPPAA